MFNNLKNILIGIVSAVIVIAIGASAYSAFASAASKPTASPTTAGAGTGSGNGNLGTGGNTGNGIGTSVLNVPAFELSAEESAALLFMSEEEKLARDVYNVLYTTWGIQTFQNIASSEQQHMDQIKLLLDQYAIAAPALAPGQFTNPDLQALHDQLTAQGSLSIGDAFKVGAAIEEIDILDLQTRFTQTKNTDIQLVYNQLMKGSFNHLQAFSSSLAQQTSETYQPQYLSADQYQIILATSNGNSYQGGTGAQGNSLQGANSLGAATGIPQADTSGAATLHGIINSFDLTGMSVTLDDGTILYVQLGNSRYSQSIGFAPQAGEAVTISGFIGDQGAYSAISVTVDSTAQIYSFRNVDGTPMWSTGNGSGQGGGNKP